MIPSIACGYLLGNVLLQCAPRLITLEQLICLLFALLLAILISSVKALKYFLFALGLAYCMAYHQAATQVAHAFPQSLYNKPFRVIAEVSNLPIQRLYGVQVQLTLTEVMTMHTILVPQKVLVSWIKPPSDLIPGQRYLLTLFLHPHQGLANPGMRDETIHDWAADISARGRVLHNLPIIHLAKRPSPLLEIRCYILQAMQQFQSNYAGILQALAIGVTSNIKSQQWEVFFATGTGHLLAISGLHVGLMAGCGFWFGRNVWALSAQRCLKKPAGIIGLMCSGIIALIYSALAGFSIPTRRSLIMILALILSKLQQRVMLPGYNYCLALLAVLILQPESTLSSGFWLSFATVGLLIYGLNGRIGMRSKWHKHSAHFILFIGMMPLSLWLFGQYSLTSIIANLVAIPIIGTAVVPLTLIGVIFTLLHMPFLSHFFWSLADFLLRVIWPVMNWLGNPDQAIWWHGVDNIFYFVLATVGALLILLPRSMPGRSMGFVWLLPLYFVRPSAPAFGELKVTLLDVGQGLSVVVQTAKHQLIYDTGLQEGLDSDSAKRVIIPFLHAERIHVVHKLIVSHADLDHRGGAQSLLAHMPIDEVIATRTLPKIAQRFTLPCQSYPSWTWDNVHFQFLTTNRYFTDRNNDSCVLHMQVGQMGVLIPGDIEAPAEQALVQRYQQQLASQVLVAAHHGSKTSSTVEFIQAVKPKYVLFATGAHNRYHFPHQSVVDRYQQMGVKGYNSAETGAITFKISANKIKPVQLYRDHMQHYWQIKST